jgi:hypothetical protein
VTSTDTDLATLQPLAALIEKTIRDTPIRMGPGGTDDLTAQLTLKTCVWVGKNVLPRTEGLAGFVAEVDVERQRQLAKWGEQHHPDGTALTEDRERADRARHICDSMTRLGQLAWRDVLLEEVYEALAETDPAALRTELLQVAAVCAAWIADLDSRAQPFTAEELATAQADVDALNAEFPDICGDANDGDWCELEPGHEGHHRADTAEWAAAQPAV